MQIFGFEKLSLVDFDGKVGATVFTGACNFRCGFCHNSPLVLDVNSIEPIPVATIFDYLKKRKGIIDGVCVSGGEPTLQKDLPEFCAKLKELELAVKVDTNGTNPDMIQLLVKENLADYFAMDIKNDKENYSKIIGIDNYDTHNVEKSVEFLMNSNVDYEFRTTIISEYHTKENVINIGKWIKGAKKYFLQQYKDSDSCILGGYTPVPEKTAKEFVELLKPFIKNVQLRGY